MRIESQNSFVSETLSDTTNQSFLKNPNSKVLNKLNKPTKSKNEETVYRIVSDMLSIF